MLTLIVSLRSQGDPLAPLKSAYADVKSMFYAWVSLDRELKKSRASLRNVSVIEEFMKKAEVMAGESDRALAQLATLLKGRYEESLALFQSMMAQLPARPAQAKRARLLEGETEDPAPRAKAPRSDEPNCNVHVPSRGALELDQ